jgi:hypothetical protein
MWARLMQVKNAYIAEAWKDLFAAEGLAVRVVPPLESHEPARNPREIWVPDSKTHVAEEILRKV